MDAAAAYNTRRRRHHPLIKHRINKKSKTCTVIYNLQRKMTFYELEQGGGCGVHDVWGVATMEVLACRCCVLVQGDILGTRYIKDIKSAIRLSYDVPIHSFNVVKCKK